MQLDLDITFPQFAPLNVMNILSFDNQNKFQCNSGTHYEKEDMRPTNLYSILRSETLRNNSIVFLLKFKEKDIHFFLLV